MQASDPSHKLDFTSVKREALVLAEQRAKWWEGAYHHWTKELFETGDQVASDTRDMVMQKWSEARQRVEELRHPGTVVLPGFRCVSA